MKKLSLALGLCLAAPLALACLWDTAHEIKHMFERWLELQNSIFVSEFEIR